MSTRKKIIILLIFLLFFSLACNSCIEDTGGLFKYTATPQPAPTATLSPTSGPTPTVTAAPGSEPFFTEDDCRFLGDGEGNFLDGLCDWWWGKKGD